MHFENVVSLIAGLSLFLYGMQRSEQALKQLAGNRMRVIIKRVTSNRIIALCVGVLMTMCTQSSSATTVMMVGFSTAGLLTLENSMGVLLGTAVGTTLTVQLFAWNFSRIAPLLIAAGFLMLAMKGSENRRNFGKLVFGFGLVFFGMQMMSVAAAGVRNSSLVETMLRLTSSSWVLMVVSAAFTAIIQSSAATVALVIGLAQTGNGSETAFLTLDKAVPLILGSNIGTCATALLASLGSNTEGKRVAWAHLFYKTIAVLAAMPLIDLLCRLGAWSAPGNPAAQVANVHTMFNVSAAIVFLPFTGLLARATKRLLPFRESTGTEFVVRFINRDFNNTPYLALSQASNEIIRMSGIVTEMLEKSWQALKSGNASLLKQVNQEDDKVDFLQERITPYLARLAETEINEDDSRRQILLLSVSSELELIGDIISKDFSATIAQLMEKNIHFSADGFAEMEAFYVRVRLYLYATLNAFATDDKTRSQALFCEKQQIDAYHEQLRLAHFNRVRHRFPETLETTTIHLDMLEDLRRVGSHAARLCSALTSGNAPLTLRPSTEAA